MLAFVTIVDGAMAAPFQSAKQFVTPMSTSVPGGTDENFQLYLFGYSRRLILGGRVL
jgi:hypothetical protein